MVPPDRLLAVNLAAPAPRGKARTPAFQEPALSLEVRYAGSEQRFLAMTILKWALIFLVVSVIAGLLGFTGVSVVSADIARVLFYVFVAIFLVLLILGLTIFRA
jgi:uncharacterized membrane protein YtjA (UPF0391 family)